MKLNAHAKINLSLEIVGKRADGYHDIDSIMQGIGLHDVVVVSASAAEGKPLAVYGGRKSDANKTVEAAAVSVYLTSDSEGMPMNESNLAMRGAKVVIDECASRGVKLPEAITIDIAKRLPVAAGIAGGSGNGAASMLGINAVLGNPLSLDELRSMGRSIGADIPFSLTMNAAMNEDVLAGLRGLEEATVAARTTGIGDIIEPVDPVRRTVIMMNPGIAVSTKEVYEALDANPKRVINRELYFNRMEEYTLEHYARAREVKALMQDKLNAECVVMSGSGPTMVAYYEDAALAEDDYNRMKEWMEPEWRAWLTETGGR